MRFNLSKCTCMCHPKMLYMSLHVSHTYCMAILLMHDHACKLENVKEHSYLGITIDQSMLFINNVTCKATKVLNFIECNLYKCSQL